MRKRRGPYRIDERTPHSGHFEGEIPSGRFLVFYEGAVELVHTPGEIRARLENARAEISVYQLKHHQKPKPEPKPGPKPGPNPSTR